MIVALLGAGAHATAARAEQALRAALAGWPVLAEPRIDGWEDPSGRTCLAWAAPHPDRVGGARLTVREPGAAAVVLGRPVRWRGEDADGRWPLDASWALGYAERTAADLDGRWAALAVRAGRPAVALTDALGAHPLHRRDLDGTTWSRGSRRRCACSTRTGSPPTPTC